MVVKKTKRGQKELDLKTIIPHVEYEQAGEQLQFNLVLPCGSGEAPNYNPALLLGYFCSSSTTSRLGVQRAAHEALHKKQRRILLICRKATCQICQDML